jgi:hypothetical protein
LWCDISDDLDHLFAFGANADEPLSTLDFLHDAPPVVPPPVSGQLATGKYCKRDTVCLSTKFVLEDFALWPISLERGVGDAAGRGGGTD